VAKGDIGGFIARGYTPFNFPLPGQERLSALIMRGINCKFDILTKVIIHCKLFENDF